MKSGAMIKACLFIMICLAGGGFLANSERSTIAQAEASETKDLRGGKDLNNIILDNAGYKKNRQGPVKLSHTKHVLDYGVSCWDCHHEYDDDKNNKWSPLGTTQKCNECHDPQKAQDKAMKLQTAFHMNCKGCHKELAEKNEKAGAFKKCLKCHEKL